MTDRLAFTAMILAGGKSLRMGRDKALLPYRQKTFLEILVSLSVDLFQETLVIVNDKEKLKGLDLQDAKIYEDLIKDKGPLAAIHTGPLYSRSEACVILSCDMPRVDRES